MLMHTITIKNSSAHPANAEICLDGRPAAVASASLELRPGAVPQLTADLFLEHTDIEVDAESNLTARVGNQRYRLVEIPEEGVKEPQIIGKPVKAAG